MVILMVGLLDFSNSIKKEFGIARDCYGTGKKAKNLKKTGLNSEKKFPV